MVVIVHLRIGIQWNLVALWTPLQVTLFTPMKAIDNGSMVMLSNVGPR
jgi:hypothetical protein